MYFPSWGILDTAGHSELWLDTVRYELLSDVQVSSVNMHGFMSEIRTQMRSEP